MNGQDAVLWAEEKGLDDGASVASYSPPITFGICPEADDAYTKSYWYALAYLSTSGGWIA